MYGVVAEGLLTQPPMVRGMQESYWGPRSVVVPIRVPFW